MCKRILKNQTSENEVIPFYKIGTFGKQANSYISNELFEEYRDKYSYPNKGDVLISASGTIGRTVVFNGEPSYFQDSNIVWLAHDETLVLNKYLYYFYATNPWKISDGGTIGRLYNSDIQKTIIPLPPLAEQQRIVDVLDKFDTLVHSLSEGLPKEIEQRQQQYEYYRDKLLDFETYTL
ncbi:restriction endonuclease subunit S [Aerococcaceae bacterium NML210727]|nr:restriction endonuclease subunit S [Aerococcaceae bacterium NML210727]MCW6654611.1 restriction endonuclease subunit S [Aerococcaceae bacterium NML201296]